MKFVAIPILLAVLFAGPTLAQQKADDHSAHHPAGAATAGDLADGEVRRIDKGAAKLTLRHGEIKHLDMPSMTMVFQVTDPSLLDRVKVGDKVKFRAEKTPAGYAVTAIETIK